jgi:hypothetical protein
MDWHKRVEEVRRKNNYVGIEDEHRCAVNRLRKISLWKIGEGRGLYRTWGCVYIYTALISEVGAIEFLKES